MPDFTAGSASIRIRPNADDFVRDLKAKLEAYRDPGFTVTVHAATREAERSADEFRTEQERRPIDVDVDVDTKGARAHIDEFRESQRARDINIRLDVNVDNARAQVAAMRRELTTLDNTLGGLSGSFRSFGNNPLTTTIAAASFQLPAFATGLAEVAAAMQQVAQAGIAIPGAIAGAGASIGTLVIGLSGIKDAYTAVTRATADSAQSQQQHAAAARQAESASNSLRNAVTDEARARKDVVTATRDAQQALRDLTIEQRGGMLSESRAILEAQKAREDLARGKYSDIRDASLRVQEADQRLLEVRARNADTQLKLNDAQTKGVQGSDQVTAANERLTRTTEQVAEAQARAAESGGAMSAAQSKAEQTMAALGPSAQAVVRALVELKPAFQGVRTAVSEPLLAGKADEIQHFVNDMIPTLKTGLGGIAAAWNRNITQLFASVGSPQSKGLIGQILGDTGDAQGRFTQAIGPLVAALETLSRAGADSLPRLAAGFTAITERFAKFIDQADKSGALDTWINEGLTGMRELGDAVLNLGKAFNGITEAAGGQTFLKWLEDATGRLQTFLNSARGQNDLKAFFAEGRREFEQWKPILQELPGIFKGALDGARSYIGAFLPLIRELADLLGKHPALVKAMVAAYLTMGTVRAAVGTVQTAMQGLSGTVTALGTGFAGTREKARAAMKGVDEEFTKAGHPNSGMGKFSGALAALSGAGGAATGIGLLVSAGIPLVQAFAAQMNRAMDGTKQHVDAVNQSAQALIGTLDDVTNAAGQATRGAVAKELGQARPEARISALGAAAQLGVGGAAGQDIVSAALPGGDQLYQQYLTQARGAVRGTVRDFISHSVGGRNIADFGVSEDDVVDAYLGVPAALDKLNKAGASSAQAADVLDLGRLNQQVLRDRPQVQQWSALLQALNLQRSSVTSAAGQATAAQGAASGPPPQLGPAGAGQFGQDAQVFASGGVTKIVTHRPPTKAQLDALAAAGAPAPVQGVPPNQNTWTWTLSPDDARKFTYESGGPTENTAGGYTAVVHPKEWMLNQLGRKTVGDDFAAAANRGVLDPTLLPRFQEGGDTDRDDRYAPVGPNPFGGGGPSAVIGHAVQGAESAINKGMSLIQQQQQAGQGQGQGAGGQLQLPGFQAGGPIPEPPHDPLNAGLGGGDTPPAPGVAAGLPSVIGAISGPAAPSDTAPAPAGLPAMGGNILGALGSAVPGLSGLGSIGGGGGGRSSGPVPGLIGLGQIMAGGGNPQAIQAWQNQTADWTANWAGSTLAKFGQILGKGALDFVGLGGLLSYVPDIDKTVTHFSNLGQALNAPAADTTGDGSGIPLVVDPNTGVLTIPSALTGPGGVPTGGGTSAQNAINYAVGHAVGQPYSYGGIGPTGYDCSGIASAIYAAAKGLPQGQRYFSTESDFLKLGFQPGFEPGALNIGISRGGGGPNSHMALTLPNGINVESGGASDTTQYGGTATGAKNFPLQYHLPLAGGTADLGLAAAGVALTGGQPAGAPGAAPAAPGTPAPASTPGGGINWPAPSGGGPMFLPSGARNPQDEEILRKYGLLPGGGAPSGGRPKLGAFGNFDRFIQIARQRYPQQLGQALITGSPTSAPSAGAPTDIQISGLPGGGGQGLPLAPGGGGTGQIKALAYRLYMGMGMPPGEWNDFDWLINKESSWNPTAKNPSSTAFGLGQFLSSTQAAYGISGVADPGQQLLATFAYLRSRYHGSPAAARAFHLAHNWYAGGGLVAPQGNVPYQPGSPWDPALGPAAPGPTFGEGPQQSMWPKPGGIASGMPQWWRDAFTQLDPAAPRIGGGPQPQWPWWKWPPPGTIMIPSGGGPMMGNASGGMITGGQGGVDDVPAWLTAGEFVVNKDSAARFLPMLHHINSYQYGGLALAAPLLPPQPGFTPQQAQNLQTIANQPVATKAEAAVPPPEQPQMPQIPNVQPMVPRPAPGGPAQAPAGGPAAGPAAPQPLPTAPPPPPGLEAPPVGPELPAAPMMPPTAPYVPPQPTGKPQITPEGRVDHNLPAVKTTIQSGARAIGQAVATAIALAGSAAGGMGGGAAGALAPYAAGLVQQGGKVVEGVANVVSSALVGSVPGSLQTTSEAYGRTLRPEQNIPATATPNRMASYGPFFGHDTKSVMQEINLHESLEQQSHYANYGAH